MDHTMDLGVYGYRVHNSEKKLSRNRKRIESRDHDHDKQAVVPLGAREGEQKSDFL